MVRPIEVGRRLKGAGTVIEVRGCCWLAQTTRGKVVEFTMGETVLHADSSFELLGTAPRGGVDPRLVELFRSKADAITARRAAEFDPDRVVKIWD